MILSTIVKTGTSGAIESGIYLPALDIDLYGNSGIHKLLVIGIALQQLPHSCVAVPVQDNAVDTVAFRHCSILTRQLCRLSLFLHFIPEAVPLSGASVVGKP